MTADPRQSSREVVTDPQTTPEQVASKEYTGCHLVVMGVAGSGKSTVAEQLSNQLGLPLAEADDFHSAQNVTKMAAGDPLTTADRLPWLHTVREWMTDHAATGSVLTCSALRRSYRDLLCTAAGEVVFLHLDADPALLKRRLRSRAGHFMPTMLLESQLESLEPLDTDEDGLRLVNEGSIAHLTAQAVDLARRWSN